jgi:SH3-like domain-containing protein
MKKLILISLLILLLFNVDFSNAKTLSVVTEKADLLSGPGNNFQIKCEYSKGFPVKVKSFKGQWVKIEDFENDSGWISKKSLSEAPYVIVKANRNSENKINIRVGPGDSYKIIGQAFYGVVLEKIEIKNGWVKVRHDTGLVGWVLSSLLWGL